MSLNHWLAFAAASAILLAIPGPTALLSRPARAGRYGNRVFDAPSIARADRC